MARVLLLCAALALVAAALVSAQAPAPISSGAPAEARMLSQADKLAWITDPITLDATNSPFVTFSVTPVYGDADFSIGVSGGASGLWNATGAIAETKTVMYNDPAFVNGAQYIITVTAYSDIAFFYVTYHVYTSSGANLTTLSDSVPMVMSTPSGKYQDFYYAPNTNRSVSFALTRLNGDPDLYVASPNGPLARRGASQWSAASSSSEFLYLDPTVDTKVQAKAPYYASVYGYSAAEPVYTLTASVESGGHEVMLLERFPHEEVVQGSGLRYFMAYAPKGVGFRITVERTSASGDPDLYIKDGDNTAQDPCQNRAGPGAWDWYSISSRVDMVTISAADTKHQSDWLCISVRGFGTTPASFRLYYVALGDAVVLEEGSSQTVTVTSDLPTGVQFVYQHNDPKADLIFESVDFPGKCTLFASRYPLPTPDKNMFAGNYSGYGSTIVIPQAAAGDYFVGAYIWTGYNQTSATCVISARTSQSSELLIDGVPLYGRTVIEDGYRYYDFQVTDPTADVIISLTPLAGMDADLYAAFGYRPNTTVSQFQSMRLGSDQMFINHSSPYFVPGSTLYITVYGWTAATYSIMGYTANSSVVLSDGLPQDGLVGRKRYHFYQIDNVVNGATLLVELISQAGDADLYGGFGNDYLRPDNQHYQFSSTHYAGDYLVVSNAMVGTYHISVYGFSTAAYTIVAYFQNPSQTPLFELQEGRPQQVQIPAGSTLGVDMVVFMDDPTDIIASTTPYNGFAKTYMRFGGRASVGTFDISDVTQYPGNTIYARATSAVFRPGLVFLHIDNSGSGTLIADVLVTQGAYVTLEEGRPLLSKLVAGSSLISRIFLPSPADGNFNGKRLVVGVPVFSSSVNVTVAKSSTFATPLASGSGAGFHHLFVRYSDIFTAGQMYPANVYIRIDGVNDPSATFSISATGDTGLTRIIRGAPAYGFTSLDAPQPDIARFTTPLSAATIAAAPTYFVLYSCSNDYAPTFTAGLGADPTSVTNVQVSTSNKYASFMQFAGTQAACTALGEPCFAQIAVNGSSLSKEYEFGMIRVEDSEPAPDMKNVLLGTQTGRTVTVKAEVQANVEYAFYVAPSYNSNRQRINMHTTCGCEKHAIMRSNYGPASAFQTDGSFVYYQFNLPSDNMYTFCVTVRNAQGIERPYTPLEDLIVLSNGKVLSEDNPFLFYLDAGETRVYAFNHMDPTADFQISSTAYAGFATVFAKWGSAPLPDGSDADKFANNTNPGNTIYIDTSDNAFATGPWFFMIKPITGPAYLSIEVNAYSPTNLYINLLDNGTPVLNAVPFGDVMLYQAQVFVDGNTVVEVSANAVFGRIDLFAGFFPNVTFANSAAASEGAGSRALFLFSRDFPGTGLQTLYIGVRGARMGRSAFILTTSRLAGQTVDETLLLWGVPQFFAAPMNVNRTFITPSVGSEGQISVIAERCDNMPNGQLTMYYGRNYEPTTSFFDQKSVAYGTNGDAILNVNVLKTDFWQIAYFAVIGTNSFEYSLTRYSDSMFARPNPGTLTVTSPAAGTIAVAFTDAQYLGGHALEYSVFYAPQTDDWGFSNNLRTVCGAERNSFIWYGYRQATPNFFPRNAQNQLTHSATYLAAGTYVVNVIVRTDTGMYASYGVQTITVQSDIVLQPSNHIEPRSLARGSSLTMLFGVKAAESFIVTTTGYVGQQTICIKPRTPPTGVDDPDARCSTSKAPGSIIYVDKTDPFFSVGQWYALAESSFLENGDFDIVVYSVQQFPLALTLGRSAVVSTIAAQSLMTAIDIPTQIGSNGAPPEISFALNMVSGTANMVVCADYGCANPVKTLTGPGSLYTAIHTASLPAGTTRLHARVDQTSFDMPAKFALSTVIPGNELTLVRGTPMLSHTDGTFQGQPGRFSTGNIGFATTLNFMVDSCTLDTAPTFYYGTGYQPTSAKSDGTSTVAAKYRSTLQVSVPATAPLTAYHLAVYPTTTSRQDFSVRFVDPDGRADPVPTADPWLLTKGDGFVTIAFQAPQVQAGAQYRVAVAIAEDNNVQFVTPCGVERARQFMSEYLPISAFTCDTPTANTYCFVFNAITPGTNYVANVLIRSDAGVLVAHTPLKLTSAPPSPSAPSFNTKIGGKELSGGSIFLIILTCLVTVYVIGGVVYNKVRKGASGVALLPNSEFWRSLPGLVADGYRFLTTCGASSYSAFQDDTARAEAGTAGGALAAAPAAGAPASETSAGYGATNRTGYGAI